MSGLLNVALLLAGLYALGWVFDFLDDPQAAIEQLGNGTADAMAAFRRGLTRLS